MVRFELGASCQWRSASAEPSDVVRAFEEGGVVLVAMANAFDSGFATAWPAGSRLLLEAFVRAWRVSTGAVPSRLARAFALARASFVAEAPASEPDDPPGASLLVVALALGEVTAHARWVGGDVALLVRSGAIVHATTPHTLRERLRAEHPGADTSEVPNVLTRVLGLGDEAPPESMELDLAAGDELLVLARPDAAELEAAARAVDAREPAAVKAERLGALGLRLHERPFAAAAVVRLG